MKNRNLAGIAIAAIAVSSLASCDILKDLEYTVTPCPVEMHGDSIWTTIKVVVPEKGLHKKAILEATPVITNSNGDVIASFETATYKGTDATGNGTVIPKAGKTITYEGVVPYTDDMENSELRMQLKATKGNKVDEVTAAESDVLCLGVDITPRLLKGDDMVIAGADQFQRNTMETEYAVIHYAKNASSVRSGEYKDGDYKAMAAFVKSASLDPKQEVKSIDVASYASPEGEMSLNANLASERAESAANALDREFKRAKAEVNYNKMPKGEDWAGFKDLVEKSNNEDKDLVIRVLEMYPNESQESQREAEIKNMAKTYNWLEDDVLPELRRSQMTLNYEQIGKTDAELVEWSKTKIDSLRAEEIMFTATLTNDLDEKLRLYKEMSRIYPNDWRGPNNVGYVYMMQGKMNDASAEFEKAAAIEATPIVHNNLGVIARLRGDIAGAKSHYDQAGGAGPEVAYNEGVIQIMEGKYEKAVSGMNSFNTFNYALARLLNGDTSGALSTIDASDDKDTAEGYYLKAVIGAKTGNNELMINNLRSAIQKDASLKDKAKKDVVFEKYRSQSDFTGLMN